MNKKFNVLFLEEAKLFLDSLDVKSREKIFFNIRKAQLINDPELFKKITDDIWEFRTLYNKTYYRLFAFWDKTNKENILVVSTHGLIKKSAKTPKADIEHADSIRKFYFKQK